MTVSGGFQMKKEWNVTDNTGNVHKIQCNLGSLGGNKIFVDNDAYKYKSSNWFINIVDYQINLPGTVCNVVIVGNKIRLAVNGVYLDDGSQYEPVSNIPTWVWVLVAVSCIAGLFLSGFIGMVIGAIFSLLMVNAVLKKKTSTAITLFVLSIVLEALLMVAVSFMI